MKNNILLSAVVLTYNEEDVIVNLLKSLNFCDEIVLVDSGSQDETVSIAKKYTNKIFENPFKDFATQKNYALTKAKGKWVVFVDADELVSAQLAKEIVKTIKNPNGYSGFSVCRKTMFMGRSLKYCGLQTEKILRVFIKEKGVFEGKVHEKVRVNGKTKPLVNRLDHYTYRGIDNFIKKLNVYAWYQASELLEKNKKITWLHFIIKPSLRFFHQYFIRKGFLDGIPGLVYCVSMSYAVFFRYTKHWLIKRDKN